MTKSNSANHKDLSIALIVYEEPMANTVFDHIEAFTRYSKHNIHKYNLAKCNADMIRKILEHKAILIHYSVFLFNDYMFPLPVRLALANTIAFKMAFIQDEYRQINLVHTALNFLKIDLLFTCVPDPEIEKVYPAAKLPFLKQKINVLTGYVPENLKTEFSRCPSYAERPLDVVYRARKLSSWYGRLGREKWQIVDEFKQHASGLLCDLSYEERDRIYGDAWIQFLKKSKSALGVESGSSIFDFTGDIQKQVEDYESKNPSATFEEIESKFFPDLDGKIYLNQISPRCFECAALGTLMILYEGEYSGFLQPWRHYIPLKKDLSNIQEVKGAIKDPTIWQEITTNAYNEVACNPQLSYASMIEKFDKSLELHYINKENTQQKLAISNFSITHKFIANSISNIARLRIAKVLYKFKHLKLFFKTIRNNCYKQSILGGFSSNILYRLECVKVYINLMTKGFIRIYKKSELSSIILVDCVYIRLLGYSCYVLERRENQILVTFDETKKFEESLSQRLIKYLLDGNIKFIQFNLKQTVALPGSLIGYNMTLSCL